MDYYYFQQRIREITTVQDLVYAFVIAHNMVGCISDLVYDYEEGSDEYKNNLETVEQWEKIEADLEKRTIAKAQEEKLLDVKKPNSGSNRISKWNNS